MGISRRGWPKLRVDMKADKAPNPTLRPAPHAGIAAVSR
jgi:hypothetical protein